MIKKIRRTLCFFALVMLSACGLLNSPKPKAPCATNITASYIAEMIKAGCVKDHFNDPQCAPIKAKRDTAEKEAGCTP